MALNADQIALLEEARLNIEQGKQYIAQSEASIARSQQQIAEYQADIEYSTTQLTNPNISPAQQAKYEANIRIDNQLIDEENNSIQVQMDSITQNNDIITANQALIGDIEKVDTSSAKSVNPTVDPEANATNTQVSVEQSLGAGEEVVTGPSDVTVEQSLSPGEEIVPNAAPVDPAEDPFEAARLAAEERYNEQGPTEEDVLGAINNSTKLKAQQQKVLSARRNLGNNADWRFKIKLAPNARYLYASDNPGILAPLRTSGGVIFPYTPQIETQYTANYDKYDLVHSNYRGYFYKGSSVNEISVRGTFTAQDTVEAQYLLAVIHFFRSVTKMFYGKDPQAGTPPPLVYISGYGPNQFNDHACVVSSFTYSLPTDVDYIRADAPNQIGVNLENRTGKTSSVVGGPFMSIVNRLKNSNLFAGALPSLPDPNNVLQTVNNPTASNATYVPTKMEINIQLLPVQTRSEVSQQFSLQGFANGQLLRGGFW